MPQANSTTSRPRVHLAERVGEHLAVLGGDDRGEPPRGGVAAARGTRTAPSVRLVSDARRHARPRPRRRRDGVVDVGGRRRSRPAPVTRRSPGRTRRRAARPLPAQRARRRASAPTIGSVVVHRCPPRVCSMPTDRQESKPSPRRSRPRSQRLRRPPCASARRQRPAGELDAGPAQRLRRERQRLARAPSAAGSARCPRRRAGRASPRRRTGWRRRRGRCSRARRPPGRRSAVPQNAQNRVQVSITPPQRWLNRSALELREGGEEVLGERREGLRRAARSSGAIRLP